MRKITEFISCATSRPNIEGHFSILGFSRRSSARKARRFTRRFTWHSHGCRVTRGARKLTWLVAVNKARSTCRSETVAVDAHLLLVAINEIRFLCRNVSVVTRVRLAYLAVETSYAPNCERLHAGPLSPPEYYRPLHDVVGRAWPRVRARTCPKKAIYVFRAELILRQRRCEIYPTF